VRKQVSFKNTSIKEASGSVHTSKMSKSASFKQILLPPPSLSLSLFLNWPTACYLQNLYPFFSQTLFFFLVFSEYFVLKFCSSFMHISCDLAFLHEDTNNFWHMTSCRLLNIYQCTGGNCYLPYVKAALSGVCGLQGVASHVTAFFTVTDFITSNITLFRNLFLESSFHILSRCETSYTQLLSEVPFQLSVMFLHNVHFGSIIFT
jgi:hypothetical protein